MPSVGLVWFYFVLLLLILLLLLVLLLLLPLLLLLLDAEVAVKAVAVLELLFKVSSGKKHHTKFQYNESESNYKNKK